MAKLEGFWTAEGVSSPNVEPRVGGSPDTARRVGTGSAQVGHADSGSAVSVLADGMNFKIGGVFRQRRILGLARGDDRIDSPEDIAGTEIVLGTQRARLGFVFGVLFLWVLFAVVFYLIVSWLINAVTPGSLATTA